MLERVLTIHIAGLAGICYGVDVAVEFVEVDAVVNVVVEFVEVGAVVNVVVEFVEVDAFAAAFVFAAVRLPVGKVDPFFIMASVYKFSLATCRCLLLSILCIFPMYLSIVGLTVYTTESMYFCFLLEEAL